MNYIIFEFAVMALFLFCLYNARKSGIKILLVLLSGIYATIFENFNVILSSGKIGGYIYSNKFNFFIGETPLIIILAWAVLIYSTYNFVNYLKIDENRKPFADAFLVTLLDVAFDPIASSMGMWIWKGYSINQGFFGVPGNNFLGWLTVTFVFMFLFRRISKLKINYKEIIYFFLPIGSYIIFLSIFTLIQKMQLLLNFDKTSEAIMFFLIFIAFLFLIKKQKFDYVNIKKNYQEIFNFYIIRIMFYLFALYGAFYLEIFRTNGAVIANIFAIIFIEVMFYYKYGRI